MGRPDYDCRMAPASRWLPNTVGSILAASILYFWLCVAFRALPAPHMSELTFVLWFIGSPALSVVIAETVSRWWYVLTGSFVLTYIVIAGGNYILER
jgi:hypothetical protein